jgi:hypothetical protein
MLPFLHGACAAKRLRRASSQADLAWPFGQQNCPVIDETGDEAVCAAVGRRPRIRSSLGQSVYGGVRMSKLTVYLARFIGLFALLSRKPKI